MSGDLGDFTYQGAAFVPDTMTRDDILALRQLAFRRFYSRPSFLVRRICALRTPSDVKAAVRGIKSLFWLWADRTVFVSGRRKAEGRERSRVAAL